MYEVHILIGIFQGWPRKILESYKVVVGFLICQYTFQRTSCILSETGGILAYCVYGIIKLYQNSLYLSTHMHFSIHHVYCV